MKRGTPEHPKIMDFAEAIHGYLTEKGLAIPFELVSSLACGMIERLWHYTARYAPAGDIGKHSDLRIALATGWQYDAQFLIETLIKCRLIDAVATESRLYVHDWHDHSDDAADKWLHDKGLTYANGLHTRRGKNEREGITKRGRKNASRQKRDVVATQTRQSEPEPEPEPRPSSEPKPSSGPRPKPALDATTRTVQNASATDSRSLSHVASPSPSRSPSPKDFSDEDGEETTSDDAPPVNLDAVDWDQALHDAKRIAKVLPPQNRTHVRTYVRLAVMCQLSLGDGFIADALAALKASPSRAGPHKHFHGIIRSKAADEDGLDLWPALQRIKPIPDDVLESFAFPAGAK